MKRIAYLLSLVLIFGWSGQAAAQDDVTGGYGESDKEERIQEATKEKLDKVMSYAKTRNYAAFGKSMVYTGKNPYRQLKVKMNAADPHEKLEIENTLNLLHHWLEKTALYNAKNFRIVHGVDFELYYWDVEFTLLNGKTRGTQFAFVELDKEFLFCRMEKWKKM